MERELDNYKPRFDPDLSPEHSYNKRVAEKFNLKYDPNSKMYVDSNGYLIRDRFGQPL